MPNWDQVDKEFFTLKYWQGTINALADADKLNVKSNVQARTIERHLREAFQGLDADTQARLVRESKAAEKPKEKPAEPAHTPFTPGPDAPPLLLPENEHRPDDSVPGQKKERFGKGK